MTKITYNYIIHDCDEIEFIITKQSSTPTNEAMLKVYIGFIYQFDTMGKEEHPGLFNINDYFGL